MRFGPERVVLFPVLIALLGTLPAAASSPALLWLLLLPLAAGTWVLRAHVTADADGLAVCNGLGTREVAWDAVAGFDVPGRGPVRLLTGGDRVPLTALSRREVRRLLEAGEQAAAEARGEGAAGA